ncbi:MAG: glucosamine-6-phosphate deaminase [Dermatophilus congolensis]|nr:glucosamine-6-phosphate deaminase [Dermatophilus congolensis]
MDVVICPDAEAVGREAAAVVARVVKQVGPEVVLGVATGSSPLALYEALAEMVQAGELDLSSARAFALDEYVGLPKGHPESYAAVIARTVTEPLRMNPELVRTPDGFADDVYAAAEEYEAAIEAAGGIDVQILGVGANGHIGFNEPTSSLKSRTRPMVLSETTRADNARFFDSIDEVPKHCLTQGLGTILDARETVLVALGEGKAAAIAGVVEGPVTTWCPGSILQFHPNVTIIVDEGAASRLAQPDFYRYEWENRLPRHS